MRGTCKQLHTAPFSVGAGPFSGSAHPETARPHTPRRTCCISPRNRPFLCSWGCRVVSDLRVRAAGVGLPRCGKRTQTPLGSLIGEAATGMTLRCLGNHMPRAYWLWCLDQILRRGLLERQSRPSLQQMSGSGPLQGV